MSRNETDRSVRPSAARPPETLEDKELDTAQGGSLNAYIQRPTGEKQGKFLN